MIGDDIEIVIARIEKNSVRIAIAAPREVPIFRGELRAPREEAPDGEETHR